MITRFAGVCAFVVLTASCALTGTAGTDTRTILVDWSHDEFASFFVANFPKRLTVTQGMKLVFRQTWTGEPHTVTAGKIVDEMAETVIPLIEKYGALPEEEVPEWVFGRFEEATKATPWAFSEGGNLNQTAAQPCYLSSPPLPTDASPCERQDKPPVFTGEEAYYNSGIIPYEGPEGNTFEVQLADDIEPGKYLFYCAVHGPFQRTHVEVKPAGSTIPSAAEVSRQARREIQELAQPLAKTFQDATEDGTVVIRGGTNEAPFAGLAAPEVTDAGINEFVPRTVSVRAGEPITWRMMGADHTISFNVPEYFPIVEFLEDGTVRMNPKIQPAAGGAPEYGGSRFREDEPPDEGEAPSDDDAGGEASPHGSGDGEQDGPPEPERFDAGTYDGSGFWSSGLVGAFPYLDYTVRITRPGTYEYACLIHPPMVGTIEVR